MPEHANGDADPFARLRDDPELTAFRFYRDTAMRYRADMRDNSGVPLAADSPDELAAECKLWLAHAADARDQAQALAWRAGSRAQPGD
jgi:hypothetical protein